MTERHWTNLVFSGGDNIGPSGLVTTFNPVVDYEYTTLLDANDNKLKMSAKKFQHDYNGNVTQTIEYDWFDPALVSRDAEDVPTGVPASATVLRTVNSSHYNQASTSTSANIYAKRPLATVTPLILNAPRETTVGPSIVRFSYDGQAFDVAPTVGNLTTTKTWVDLDSKWITTSATLGFMEMWQLQPTTGVRSHNLRSEILHTHCRPALRSIHKTAPEPRPRTQLTTTTPEFLQVKQTRMVRCQRSITQISCSAR